MSRPFMALTVHSKLIKYFGVNMRNYESNGTINVVRIFSGGALFPQKS